MLLGTQKVSKEGRLEVGGCDCVDLAEQFGTPLYVLDEEAVRDACRRYVAALERCSPAYRVHYAGKAFLCAGMCRIVQEEGLGLDVASAGELYTARVAGFPMDRVNVHGNNKSRDELALAVECGVGHITVDNFLEIGLLAEALASRPKGDAQSVLIRCAPGVDPETHQFMRTGQADTKFGFNIADGSALEAVRSVLAKPGMRYDGIHFHVGSQLLDTEAHEAAIDAALDLMASIRDATGATTKELNIGGGLGVRYTSDHRPPDHDAFVACVSERLRGGLRERGLPDVVLAMEPGRSIVGEAGLTLYTVGAVKRVPIVAEPGYRVYATVDGGLSDNPRPQLYGAVYEAICANRASEPHESMVTIAGKHCETDVLIWDARCVDPAPGDLLAVQTTGAYNYSMASNYNRLPRPAVVSVRNGSAELLVRRETLEDVVRLDIRPASDAAPVHEACMTSAGR